MASGFVVYIIERRRASERVFGPVAEHGAYRIKREALVKVRQLTVKYPENEYRAKDYWDQRPW